MHHESTLEKACTSKALESRRLLAHAQGHRQTWRHTTTAAASAASGRDAVPACRTSHDMPIATMPKAIMWACIQKRLCTYVAHAFSHMKRRIHACVTCTCVAHAFSHMRRRIHACVTCTYVAHAFRHMRRRIHACVTCTYVAHAFPDECAPFPRLRKLVQAQEGVMYLKIEGLVKGQVAQ